MTSYEVSSMLNIHIKERYQTLTYTLENGIFEISLNRQKALNAFNMTMFLEIFDIFRAINYSEKDIRCVVLRGAGKHFSVGLDCKFSSEGDGTNAVHSDFGKRT